MSDEELPPEHKAAEARAQLFEQMAAQIRLNKDAVFGGAFVMVSPDTIDESTAFRSLMLDQAQPGIFWASIQTIVQIAMNELEKQSRQQQQGFGR